MHERCSFWQFWVKKYKTVHLEVSSVPHYALVVKAIIINDPYQSLSSLSIIIIIINHHHQSSSPIIIIIINHHQSSSLIIIIIIINHHQSSSSIIINHHHHCKGDILFLWTPYSGSIVIHIYMSFYHFITS